MIGQTLIQQAAGSRLVRPVVERALRRHLHQRARELAAEDIVHRQTRTLLDLVRYAQRTPFGRAHDFGRIRAVRDFQRLVPVRSISELAGEYGAASAEPAARSTWPGPISVLTPLSIPGAEGPQTLPVSSELLSSHRRALFTALALIQHSQPTARLFLGQVAILIDDPPPNQQDACRLGEIDALALQQLAPFWRAFFQPITATAPLEQLERLPVTCAIGSPPRLLRLRELAGRELSRLWPHLSALIATRTPAIPPRASLAQTLGCPSARLLRLEMHPAGALAIEDPQWQMLRLVGDLGVFYEFVPIDELGKRKPVRHTVAEVERGVRYGVVISSAAGLWACVLDQRVMFDRRDPPLLRLLPPEQPSRTRASLPVATENAPSFPTPALSVGAEHAEVKSRRPY